MTPGSHGGDPDTRLNDIRQLAERIRRGVDDQDINIQYYDTDELRRFVELFQALDESLSTGGTLPAAWTQGDVKGKS